MKLASQIAQKELEYSDSCARLVHYITVLGGWRKLPEPTMSNELRCTACDGKRHNAVTADRKKGPEKVRICTERNCVTNSNISKPSSTTTPTRPRKGLEWPLFCELSGIGDFNYQVSFSDVKQSPKMREAMSKFLDGNHSFLIMMGDKGTGKSYAAMAVCELFTRQNDSCVFTTQRKMMDDWMEARGDPSNNYISRISNVQLLVIDDFGTGNIANGFMTFFMDLMNMRMQWRNRRTVITTNLDDQGLISTCGDALSDRLRTGEILKFKGNSRR